MWARSGPFLLSPGFSSRVVLEHGRRAGHHRGTALIQGLCGDSRPRRDLRPRGGAMGREALGRVYRQHEVPALIETVETLDGAWIADVARRQGRMAGPRQLYILVAEAERDVGVISARFGPASRLYGSAARDDPTRFLGPLQAGEADESLVQGVRAIGGTLDPRPGRDRAPGVPSSSPQSSGGPGGPAHHPGSFMGWGQDGEGTGSLGVVQASQAPRPGPSAALPRPAPGCRESLDPSPRPIGQSLFSRPEIGDSPEMIAFVVGLHSLGSRPLSRGGHRASPLPRADRGRHNRRRASRR